MGLSEQTKITLVVHNEEDLYTPFSPEDEFNETVKSYIKSKNGRENRQRRNPSDCCLRGAPGRGKIPFCIGKLEQR